MSTGDEFKAGVALWWRSWHQVPAGSLPDNDRALAMMAGYGKDVDGFLQVKAMALHGFKRCESDGRLYHPLVAELALKAYGDLTTAVEQGRIGGKKSGESRRRKRDGEDYSDEPKLPGIAMNPPSKAPSNPPSKAALKGGLNQMNEGRKEENEEKEDARASRADLSVMFNQFWARYPHKVGKHGDKGARKYFERVMNGGANFDSIMAGLERYIATKPADRPWCNPATWLNQGRWKDELAVDGTAQPVGDSERVYESCVHGEIITDVMAPAKYPIRHRHMGRIFLQRGTDEWSAWTFYYGEVARQKNVPVQSVPYHLDGGWSFPSRWPPGHENATADTPPSTGA